MERLNRLEIGLVDPEQLIGEFFWQMASRFKEKFAREGISVRMQALGWKAEQEVTGNDVAAGEHAVALNSADDKARQVVFTHGVQARHLGSFASDQRAAVVLAATRNSCNDAAADGGIELADCEVIEKEQGRCALDSNVIDAMVDQILADRVVAAGCEGDFQLRSHSVGGTDQDRVTPTFQRETGPEAADSRENVWSQCFCGVPLDQGYGANGFVDVDASIAIGRWSGHC